MPSLPRAAAFLRSFLRRPETLAGAILLGCGLGAAGIVFALVDSLLLRPLPYPHAERLVMIWQGHREQSRERQPLDPEHFQQLRERTKSFAALEAFVSGPDVGFDLVEAGGAERIAGAAVTPGFFAVLGVQPALGRSFQGTSGDQRAVLLGHSLWLRRFGGDPTIVGRPVRLSGESWTVAGVMPPGFDFPGVELWVPEPLQVSRAMNLSLPITYGFRVVGRLSSQASPSQAREEAAVLGRSLFAGKQEGLALRVVSLREDLLGEMRPVLWILLFAVGALLTATCANAANLLLVQLEARRREIALRAALGAGRARLALQLLAEGLLLGVSGGGLGLLVCVAGLRLLRRLPVAEASWAARFDGRSLAFLLGGSVLCGLVVALLPVWRGSRIHPAALVHTLSGGATGRLGPRAALVIAEVALALVLLAGAALLIRSVASLVRHDLGFNPRGVLSGKLVLTGSRYAKAKEQAALLEAVARRSREVPGVLESAVTNSLPFEEGGLNLPLLAEGAPPESDGPAVDCVMVSPGYFRTLEIHGLQGRDFMSDDRGGSVPVVILDREAARLLFQERDPLGKRVQVFGTWREVIGVVPQVEHGGFRREARPMAYLPFTQFSLPWPFFHLIVRTRSEPESLVPALRAALAEIDPDQALSDISPLADRAARSTWRERAVTVLLGLFAIFTLALALGGVYAVVAFAAQHRRREMAIRAALGARRGSLLREIASQGARLVFGGILFGALASMASNRLLASLLYGVAPGDPVSLLGAALLLAILASAAALIPAWRVLRLDPAQVLKAE